MGPSKKDSWAFALYRGSCAYACVNVCMSCEHACVYAYMCMYMHMLAHACVESSYCSREETLRSHPLRSPKGILYSVGGSLQGMAVPNLEMSCF